MTQAFNLSQFANSVDSTGKASLTTGVTGTLPLANGGTGATNTVNTVVAGSGISVSTSGTQVTVSSSGGAGTVTSVATGNGLQGGTITTSGTLSVACPTFNTVGSYCLVRTNPDGSSLSSGSNYPVGYSAANQLAVAYAYINCSGSLSGAYGSNVPGISGTWKWMGGSMTGITNVLGIACRVS